MNYELDATESTLSVWTYKAGLLAKLAHDLNLRATGWTAPLTVEDGRFSVRVEVPVKGLRVQGQVKGERVVPLKFSDQQDIEKNMRDAKVLDAQRFPEIVYVAEGQEGREGGLSNVAGQLTVKGRTGSLPLAVKIEAEGDALRVTGEVRFDQSDFGIKPFSALMGALKIKDSVRVSWSLRYVTAAEI
jgi:hypothetical protein